MEDPNQDLLLFILRYLRENGFQPTTQEMADHFGVTVPTINNRLWKLEEDGYLTRVGARALRIKHLEVSLKFKEQEGS